MRLGLGQGRRQRFLTDRRAPMRRGQVDEPRVALDTRDDVDEIDRLVRQQALGIVVHRGPVDPEPIRQRLGTFPLRVAHGDAFRPLQLAPGRKLKRAQNPAQKDREPERPHCMNTFSDLVAWASSCQ